MSTLSQKSEAAMKARAETVSLANRGNAAVFPGLDGVELPLNRIEVSAKQGPEDETGMGNYWMDCTVKVFSTANGDGAESAHDSRSDYTINAFNTDTIAADLSSGSTNFTCMGIKDRSFTRTKEERHFVSSYSFMALCASADF